MTSDKNLEITMLKKINLVLSNHCATWCETGNKVMKEW